MPSQGEGEQSLKLGGPCPYCPHPLLCCKLENDFPLPPLVPPVPEFATVISNACSLDRPLESETERPKLKFPVAVGVPEIAPLLTARRTPCGNCPDATDRT